MKKNRKTLIGLTAPTIAFFVVAGLTAAFAGLSYAIVVGLIGLVIIGGLAAGWGVAQADDQAPFSEDDRTEAGDSPEHSEVTSADTAPSR